VGCDRRQFPEDLLQLGKRSQPARGDDAEEQVIPWQHVYPRLRQVRSLDPVDQRDGPGGDPLRTAERAQTLGRCALDRDEARPDSERPREALTHRINPEAEAAKQRYDEVMAERKAAIDAFGSLDARAAKDLDALGIRGVVYDDAQLRSGEQNYVVFDPNRLNIVEIFKSDALLRNDLREHLSEIGDMERIITRINYSRTANARDLIYLKRALKILPNIKHTLGSTGNIALTDLVNSIGEYSEIISLIDEAIIEEPPTTTAGTKYPLRRTESPLDRTEQAFSNPIRRHV